MRNRVSPTVGAFIAHHLGISKLEASRNRSAAVQTSISSRSRSLLIVLVLTNTFVVAGCANLQTVNRTTDFETNVSKAVHLDAQQRLVMFGPNGYCAEPSPDALAAYASSLGLGVGGSGQRAASASSAIESAAGSIGLRTQSITLLRDALYRTCEASMNRSIGQRQVASLLVRSQNLSAVVLAIEQLTGTVAARQVILGGTAEATASATLLTNQKLLDEARKQEAAKKEIFDQTTATLRTASDDADKADTALKAATAANTQASAAGSTATAEEKAAAAKKLSEANEASQAAVERRNKATSDVAAAKKSYEDSTASRKAIEQLQDSALATATSHTSSSGKFSDVVERATPDAAATIAVANAVSGMVDAVLKKSYLAESCVDLVLMTPSQKNEYYSARVQPGGAPTAEQRSSLEQAQEMCLALLSQEIGKEVADKSGK